MDDTHVRVILVDDHEIVRNGLSNLFERTGTMRVIGQAGSVDELRLLSVPTTPDLILLDLHLREGNGLNALKEIRSMWSSAKVLILSGFADPLSRSRALEMNVEGYILKELSGGEIVDVAHRIVRGERVYYDSAAEAAGGPSPPRESALYRNLGPREREVLNAIGEGKLNKEIAAELHIAEKSVRNIITRLFRKLEVSNRTEAAILYARLKQGRPDGEGGEGEQ